MIATGFDEEDAVLEPPDGMTADQCTPLPVKHSKWGQYPVIISCWKLTKDELAEIQRTGRIWLVCVGEVMAPVQLLSQKPDMTDSQLSLGDSNAE